MLEDLSCILLKSSKHLHSIVKTKSDKLFRISCVRLRCFVDLTIASADEIHRITGAHFLTMLFLNQLHTQSFLSTDEI